MSTQDRLAQSWLTPVGDALSRLTEPVTVFVRDDDAGWDDDGLMRLLDAFTYREVPIDLAVIPAELSERLGATLVARANDGLLGLHQHGWTHTNHESTGRKCEFGATRSPSAQRADIIAGQARLQDLLGPANEPIFTPPWNRCSPVTAACLTDLGFSVLSRDVTAEPFNQPHLAETPVAFDWSSRRHPNPVARGIALANLIDSPMDARPGNSIGIMLHHAAMTTEEVTEVGQLLDLLSSHPLLRFVPLRQVAAGSCHNVG